MSISYGDMPLPIFKKIITRDLSLFSLQMWTLGYLEIKHVFTDGYHIAGGIKRNGVFDIYRAESEHAATLHAFVDTFLHDADTFKRIAQETLVSVNKIRDLIEVENLDKAQIQTLVDLYIHAWPGIIATYYLPTALQERQVNLNDKQVHDLQASNDIRLKTEAYYDQVDEYILRLMQRQRPDISEDLLKCTSLEEIQQQHLPDEDVLRERETWGVVNGQIFSQQDLVEKVASLGYEMEKKVFDKNISALKGQVAFKGKATGSVKVIFNKKDAHKVLVGDILVAPMTNPDYLPAMKLAAAFITDEGGVLCHAAIVARELQRPCIIGTKVATDVLQDGDRVEVDADLGIVKILK